MVIVKKIRIFLIFLIIFLLFSNFNVTASILKIWKTETEELWINYFWYVNDRALHKNHTYEKLRTFFNGCNSPLDFYNRVQEYVKDAYKDGDPDTNKRDLPSIVNEIIDKNATLDCWHQTLLLVGGIISVFSVYNEGVKRYTLNKSYGNFKLEIWRSFDIHPPIYPYRSHIQLVVDKWNGTNIFDTQVKIINKIEIDTWENEYRPFNKRNDCLIYPFLPSKLNSIIDTRYKFFFGDFILNKWNYFNK